MINVELAKKLIKTKNLHEVGRILKCSACVVQYHLLHAGTSATEIKKGHIKVQLMSLSGKATFPEMAEKTGINLRAVKKYAKKIGIKSSANPYKERNVKNCRSSDGKMRNITIATQFVNASKSARLPKVLEERMIKDSVLCEKFGPDDLRYTFKDGSTLLNRIIVDEWVI